MTGLRVRYSKEDKPSTTDVRAVMFTRDAKISRGEEIIFGTRLERRFIRWLREKAGIEGVIEQYPHLFSYQVEAC